MTGLPPEVLAAIDSALAELPQPENRHERDRWRTVSRVAVTTATSAIERAERERLRTVIGERFKTVLAWPANGYPVDAVPWSSLLDLLGPGGELLKEITDD
jgi:hypothetical protein